MRELELTVELLGTLGCHLCDEALSILEPVCARSGHRLAVLDIMDDPVLEQRYWDRIPVVRRTDTEAEIGWPFTVEQIDRLLGDAS